MHLANNYVMLEILAKGGHGVVYKVQRHDSPELFALKVYSPVRHTQEFAIHQRLTHPSIVPVLEEWHTPQASYTLMPFIVGGNLRSILDGRMLPVRTVLKWLIQLANVLTVVHEQAVIHQDLKPENILFDQTQSLLLSDFSLAVFLPTEQTSVTGSLLYLAPEKILQQPPTVQVDIYAFGMLMYELLAGKHPYLGLNTKRVLLYQLHENLPDIRQIRPQLSIEWYELILATTHKEPTHRIDSMQEVLQILERLAT
jgi:eukaryotic-like serine/threonine-protein kinase